jgi:cyanophycinase
VSTDNRTVLHTRDSETAETEDFVEPLKTADAVWFTGGRQWRLVEAYAGTKTEAAFRDVLERGGVIGGSSAGASIQGSFLVRGDPKTKKIVVGEYTEGFGYLPNSAIDQHLLARDREYDLISVIEKRPRLLGLGIDERAAVIVHEDTLRVMGKSTVAVYDAHRWEQGGSKDEKFFFLQPGDRFNLDTRTVIPEARQNP